MKLWQPGEGLTRDGGDATPGRQRQFVAFHAGANTERPVDDSLTADQALDRLARAVFGLGGSQPRGHRRAARRARCRCCTEPAG